MVETAPALEFARGFAAAVRARALYTPGHPIAERTLDTLTELCRALLLKRPSLTIGFVGANVVVGDRRLPSSSALGDLARHIRDRGIEKVTFARDVGRDDLRAFVSVLSQSHGGDLAEELGTAGIKGITAGGIAVEHSPSEGESVGAASRLYTAGAAMAQTLWEAAHSGNEPDPTVARSLIASISGAVGRDRTMLTALTTVNTRDQYTFTHMVNVAILTMAQARSLGIHGPQLRELGLAGLMHDIGKVRTPPEIINKPGRLSGEEFTIMKRHVVDGAEMLRRLPDIPALAPIVAFEHHLNQDLSGYPENIGHRTLNLGTMFVSIADVFDALRTKRSYRDALPAERVRTMLVEGTGTKFEPTLLKRFIALMGMFPTGTLVRLWSGETAVVVAQQPSDPANPQVKVVLDPSGNRLPEPELANTWERNQRGQRPRAVLEAVDPATVPIDPLTVL